MSRNERVGVRATAALLLAAQTGCYAYAPVSDAAELRRAESVRARLAPPTDVRLSAYTANEIVQVQGEVIRWAPDSLALSVFGLRTASGQELRAQGETVRLPRAQIARVERRRLDALRTGLLAAGAVLAGVLFGAVLEAAGGDEGGGTGGGEPR